MAHTVQTPAEPGDIRKCLSSIIQSDNCVLCYDKNLVEQIPTILKENFGINSIADACANSVVARLMDILGVDERSSRSLDVLPELIVNCGVDPAEYSMIASPEKLDHIDQKFDHWTEQKASSNCDSVLALQKDLGMGRWNKESNRYVARRGETPLRDYLRSVTSPPASLLERAAGHSYWALKIKWWKALGWIDGSRNSLSVGPRWITEIEYFRQILGLEKHIGLDLFSDNEELVVAGDMHNMPFPDSYFNMIFLKNVADKSYDIRRFVDELIRTTEPGGIIVVDQVCGYGDVSPLNRTDIQRADNLLRIFKSKTTVDTLVCKNIDITNIGDRSKNNARLAIRIPKL